MKRSRKRRAVRVVCRPQDIPCLIHCGDRWVRASGRYLERIAALPAIEIPEDAVARARSQDSCVRVASSCGKQTVPEEKEKRFVFDDRAANASRVFIQVRPVGNNRVWL